MQRKKNKDSRNPHRSMSELSGTKPAQRDRSAPSHAAESIHRELNWKVLVITIIAIVVMIPSAYFLHRYQIKRLVHAFLDRASEYENANEPDYLTASRHLQDYLRLRPDDAEQRIRLARVFGKIVKDKPEYTATSVRLNRQAIAAANKGIPDEEKRDQVLSEMRRATVPLLIAMRQFKQAETEILRQLPSKPNEDGRCILETAGDRQLLAEAILKRVQIGAIRRPFKPSTDNEFENDRDWTVGEVLWQALELIPSDPNVAVSLAQIYRDQPELLSLEEQALDRAQRIKAANAIVETMVTSAPSDPNTHLAAYKYYRRYSTPSDFPDKDPNARKTKAAAFLELANAELDEAIRIAPDQTNTLLAAAERERLAALRISQNNVSISSNSDTARVLDSAGHITKAIEYYRKAIDVDPTKETAYLGLSEVLLDQQKFDEVIALSEDGFDSIETPGFYLKLQTANALIGRSEVKLKALKSQVNDASKSDVQDEIDLATKNADKNIREQLDGIENSPLFSRLPQSRRDDLRQRTLILQGRWQLVQDHPANAIPHLRKAQLLSPKNAAVTPTLVRCKVLLADAYTKLQLWDLAAGFHDELSQLRSGQPGVQSLLSAAWCWRKAGQPSRAVPQYRRLLNGFERKLEDDTLTEDMEVATQKGAAAISKLLAEAVLADQVQRPSTSRDWSEYETAQASLESHQEYLETPWISDILFAAYAISRLAVDSDATKNTEVVATAVERLKETQEENADSPAFVARAAVLFQKLGQRELADNALRQLESADASQTDVALTRAQVLKLRGETDEGMKLLTSQLTKPEIADEEKTRLRAAISRVDQSRRKGTSPAATEIDIETISDASNLLRLANTLLASQDIAKAKKIAERIETLETAASPRYKYVIGQATLLEMILSNAEPTDPRMEQIARLQREIEEERPEWPDGYLLKSGIAARREDLDSAISACERAIELGANSTMVHERLARLMWRAGRNDYGELLDRMGSRVDSITNLSGVSIKQAMDSGDLKGALTRAESGVKTRPKDPQAHIWLGNVLFAHMRAAESEKDVDRYKSRSESEFKKATELSPTDLRTWSSLFGFYVQTGKPELARKTVDQATKENLAIMVVGEKPRLLTNAEKQSIIAQFEYRLGDKAEAKDRLARAVDLTDDDSIKVQILFTAAKFDQQESNLDAAINKLNTAFEIDPKHNQVRRTLAAAHAARGNDGDFQVALQLFPDVSENGEQRELDQRLRAILYAKQAEGDYRDNLKHAVQIYEDLVAKNSALPGDLLQLGNLYAIQSQIESTHQGERSLLAIDSSSQAAQEIADETRETCLENAHRQFVNLLSTDNPNYQYVVQFMRFLSYNGFHDEMEDWLGSLRKSIVGKQKTDLNRLMSYLEVLIQFDCQDGANRALQELDVRMSELLRSNTTLKPDIQVKFARFCLALKRHNLARTWIGNLEKSIPDSLPVVALNAQWLHEVERDAEIEPLIEAFAKKELEKTSDDKQKASFCYAIGRLYSEVELHRLATPWYEDLVKLMPTGYASMARNLAFRGRASEMLRVCEAAIPSVGLPKVAGKCADILASTPGLSEMSLHTADDLIAQAISESPDDIVLLLSCAALYARQQQVKEAVDIYERVLELDARNVTALNNLATLLLELPGEKNIRTAIQDVDKAIVFTGVVPALLDTRGMALLAMGQLKPGQSPFWYAEAASVLRSACWSPKADARHWFHLAIALEKTNQLAESDKAFQIAMEKGLEEMLLTPGDLRHLTRFKNRQANSTASIATPGIKSTRVAEPTPLSVNLPIIGPINADRVDIQVSSIQPVSMN